MIQITNEKMMAFLIKMYENSSEAIFFLDGEGEILALNPSAEQIINPSVLEAIQQGTISSLCSFCRGYTSDEELMSCTNCYLKNPEGDFSSFQVYLETRNKGVIPYAASYYQIDPEQEIFVFMLRDLTLQFKTQENLYKNQMVKQTIEAQELERKRISRELHDSVVQDLVSTLVDLRVSKYLKEDELRERISETEGTLNRLIEDVRNISVFLRPASLDDLGLEAAFRTHFKWIEKTYGIRVNLKSMISQMRYRHDIETAVYRICQEAVLNAVKYAGISEIDVYIAESNRHLELFVRDEGEGFNTESPTIKGTGLGVFGMTERAELIGGKLRLYSEQGKGTTVYLSVPIQLQPKERVET
ncbi:histidine kinase [Jeotgalibacillus alimentarius]|uniref:Sensor histidine kinase n=1 Tax=Jeotgalibacillus alimentarius TaxID=135826 RepID=A0A0C2W5C3_9BACL|nr:sensor histidine kinase [Jeotgalibacillus alimentarius]KIL51228.1 histidine kinase [Jeotgalibacillus alimentarius]